MCSSFALNACTRGANCAFAHHVRELRPHVAHRVIQKEHPLYEAHRAGYLTGDLSSDNAGIPRGRTGVAGSTLPTPKPTGLCVQCTGWHNQGKHVCFPIHPNEDIDICDVCGARLGRFPGGTSWKKAAHVKACRRNYPEQWAALMFRQAQAKQQLE